MSEIAQVFKGLAERFNKASAPARRSYYFSLGDDEKWTVTLSPEGCEVAEGENKEAEVFFKCPPELFLDVWKGRQQLGPMDFLTGKVKSNKPMLLKEFVAAFHSTSAK
jgi:putative sterol carrier protein